MSQIINAIRAFFASWWGLATTEDEAYEEDIGRNP